MYFGYSRDQFGRYIGKSYVNKHSTQLPDTSIRNAQYDNMTSYDDFLGKYIPRSNSLTVPNQLDSPFPGSANRCVSNNIHVLPDGTMIDIHTRKIINNGQYHNDQYWNDPYASINFEDISTNEWNNINDQELDRRSIQYQIWINKKNAECIRNMSDFQKSLLADFNNGKIMKLSRLIITNED